MRSYTFIENSDPISVYCHGNRDEE